MTEQEVKDKIENYNEFIDYVDKIFNNYIEVSEGFFLENLIFEPGSPYLNKNMIYFDGDFVYAEGIDNWRDGPDFYSYKMPIKFLWEENAVENLMQQRIENERETIRLKEEEEKRQQEKRDFEEYLRLQKKFGGKQS
jgi:hypothetical protein